jgi:Sec-independent protein translocase protein TatA
MFEPATQSLHETAMFAILGFLLAALYEPMRIARIFFRTHAALVAVSDFLFLSACGLIVFAYSLEFGGGHFRYYYLIGLAFGTVVYFLTVGKLINMITRAFADAIRKAVRRTASAIRRKVLLPLREKFVQLVQSLGTKLGKFQQIAENRRKDLQNKLKVVYNKGKSKPQEKQNQDENQQTAGLVIRARVRKV